MNEQNELTELVRTIFQEVSERPLGEIAPETPIAELGIDSVSLAEIVARIEDTLNIEVPVSQWLRVRTLQEVIDMVRDATGTNASTSSGQEVSSIGKDTTL